MPGHNRQREDFWDIIGMGVKHGLPKPFDARGGRFDDEERFAAALDLALPPERGLNTGDDIHAGGHVLTDEPPC